MKRLLPFLILLASACGLSAANPSFRDTTNVVNALNLLTNDGTYTFLRGLNPSNGVSIITNGSAFFGHPQMADIVSGDNVLLIARDGAKGDAGYAQVVFINSADLSVATPTNRFSHNFSGSIGGTFVGYQMQNSWPNGAESFDFLVDGDVFSQFLFTTTFGSPLDNNPMVLAPNFIGEIGASSDVAAYKFGTSHIVTNRLLATFANAGTNQFSIGTTNTTNALAFDSAGIISGYAGLASYSTLATNQIPTTGWTNDAAINVTVYTTATAVSFTINNRAGTVLYTSPTLTATLPVNLQPGWSLRAASGLTGTVLPF